MKRIFVGLALAVALMVGAHAVAYVLALRSDAYAEAERFVRNDPAIAAQIGVVEKTSLAPLDAELRFTAERGSAVFVISADGSKSRRKVEVRLEKIGQSWKVLTAKPLS